MRAKLFHFITLSLLAYGVYAQDIVWQRTFNGNSWDETRSLLPTADTGVVITGFSSSGLAGDKSQASRGYLDYWVIRTDSEGKIDWQRTLGGQAEDRGFETISTPDGGYLVGGWSKSGISGDKTLASLGGADYWIIKLDAMGVIQWQRPYGGASDDFLVSMVAGYDHTFYLSGFSNSGVSGNRTEPSRGNSDFWILKLDSLGGILWQRALGGTRYDKPHAMVLTPDSGIVVGGQSFSGANGDKTSPSWGRSDAWLLKLDKNGLVQWQRSFGGDMDDEIFDICTASGKGYLLGLSSASSLSGNKTVMPLGLSDYWLIRLDSAGNTVWQSIYGGAQDDFCMSVLNTGNDTFLIAGYSFSGVAACKSSPCMGNVDYWILKIDEQGHKIWDMAYGGLEKDYLYKVALLSDKKFIAGGFSKSPVSGYKGQASATDDYWVVKFSDSPHHIVGELACDYGYDQLPDLNVPSLSNMVVRDDATARISFSDTSGRFRLFMPDDGLCTVVPKAPDYFQFQPTQRQVTLSDTGSSPANADFMLTPALMRTDLRISIQLLPSSGQDSIAYLSITCENNGTDTADASLSFHCDTPMVFVQASAAHTALSNDSAYWNLSAIPPFRSACIVVQLRLPDLLQSAAAQSFSVFASVAVVQPDASPGDNAASLTFVSAQLIQEHFLSMDPDTVNSSNAVPWIDYSLSFSNPYPMPLQSLRICINLPIELDPTSIEFQSSSHPVSMTFENSSRLMTFTIANVPAVASSVFASRGHLRFRMQPVYHLPAGTAIPLKAVVYCDNELPFITNIVTVTSLSPCRAQCITAIQSAAQSVCEATDGQGNIVQLSSVKSDGRTGTYVWSYRKNAASAWSALPAGWTKVNGGESITRSDFRIAHNGEYRLVFKESATLCSDTVFLTFSVYPAPLPVVSFTYTCYGGYFKAVDNRNVSGAGNTYAWMDTNGVYQAGLSTLVKNCGIACVDPVLSSPQTVRITNVHGCYNTAVSGTIPNSQPSVHSVQASLNPIGPGDTTVLSVFSNYPIATVKWYKGNSASSISSSPTLLRTFPDTGTYRVRMRNTSASGNCIVDLYYTLTGVALAKVGGDSATDNTLQVYPNPATSRLWVEGHTGRLQVRDAFGRAVVDQFCATERIVIDVSSWPSGIYVLQSGRHSVKVLVTR